MYVVNLHGGGGSMSEAMDPQESVVVETAEEAEKLEEWVYKHKMNRYVRAIITTVTEVVSLDAAKEAFNKCHLLEDYDEEED